MNNHAFTVLAVDDSKVQRHYMEAKLTSLGYQAVTARDGLAALEKVSHALPDLILLDVEMPRMGGFEVARRLKSDKNTRHIPIIFITSLDTEEHLAQGMEVGGDDFFIKPVRETLLEIRVRTLLKVKHYHDCMIRHEALLKSKVSEKTHELQQAMEGLKRSSLETIGRLAQAGEFRDDITGNHVARIGHFSSIVARAMHLPEKTADTLLIAATLHDIGKIGTPDGILMKPGPLNSDEWEVIRQHPLIGAKILEDDTHEYIEFGRICALSHHERWDGDGYPYRLKGRDIPLAGRIVAVVDAFDVMTTRRPYKDPWSAEKAVKVISAEKGRQFDPTVVEAFLSSMDEIIIAMEAYKDQ